MAGIGAVMGMAGSAVGMMGSIAQSRQIKANAKNEAMQLGMKAAEERAVASREAQEKDKEGRTLLSRQQAVAASSGGGATDATVAELAGDIARETSVQKRELMRQGIQKGQDLEYKARVGLNAAEAEARSTIIGGVGNLIGGIGSGMTGLSSAYAKFGGGGPPPWAPKGAPAWLFQ